MVFLTRSLPIRGLFLSAGRYGEEFSEEVSFRLALNESFCVMENHRHIGRTMPACHPFPDGQQVDATASTRHPEV